MTVPLATSYSITCRSKKSHQEDGIGLSSVGTVDDNNRQLKCIEVTVRKMHL